MKFKLAISLLMLSLAMPVVYADALEEGVIALESFEFKRALKKLRPLAEQGNMVAQTKLGYMYLRGLGVEQDAADAIEWFKKAAEKGDAEAAYSLGDIYGNTRIGGNLVNHEKAVKWYRRAAERGYTNAQYKLAARYFDGGEGLPRDRIAAYAWMHVAARQGHHDAAEKVDLMEMILNEEELLKARTLADELATKHSPEELQY